MVGRHDYICPVALFERLHEGIPESRLVIFEESDRVGAWSFMQLRLHPFPQVNFIVFQNVNHV
jgi:hypothetical protein